jgi:hypothetical protein
MIDGLGIGRHITNPNFKIQMSKECQISKANILNLNFGPDLTFELWHLTFSSKVKIVPEY